jgi:1-deoxy-D-xylulose-5-phosphate synthase
VAFAGGLAKTGIRPIVDIYSTFLQRSFDQIFQEVVLADLPVVFCLDRAGLTGPDGPTHNGVFDIPYMRLFPRMVVMAPGDNADVKPMLQFALGHNHPTSIRYPKTALETVEREVKPVQLGRAEVIEQGDDIVLMAFGTFLGECARAAEILRSKGLSVGLVNARFAKPLDTDLIESVLRSGSVLVTVEEGTLEGGFGSAVLEAACNLVLPSQQIVRLGLPDRFVEHGERAELFESLGLTASGIAQSALNRFELLRGEGTTVYTPTAPESLVRESR